MVGDKVFLRDVVLLCSNSILTKATSSPVFIDIIYEMH